MDLIEHEGVKIDRCANCGGIWLDYLELEEPEPFKFEVCRTCGGSFFDGGGLRKMLQAG